VKKPEPLKLRLSDAVLQVRDIPGSAPGKWVACAPGAPGAVPCGDRSAAGAGHVRWEETGSPRAHSVLRLPVTPGARVARVSWLGGDLPRGEGVLSWEQEGDEVVVRPAVEGLALELTVHLEEDG